MDKSSHEEYLNQPLQTKNKHFKIATTFLKCHNGIFIGTNSNNLFHFAKSISDEDGFVQISISPGAYEIENLNNEITRTIFEKVRFAEANYSFKIKPNFSTLGSPIEISEQGPKLAFFTMTVCELF